MKLGQIHQHGQFVAAFFDGAGAHPIAGLSLVDLIHKSESAGQTLAAFAEAHAGPAIAVEPAQAVVPPEIWASGCTYETSASFRDAEHGTREGFYAHVYKADRPEIFFKGTARHAVGHNDPIGARFDSKFTAPEPEIALLLGGTGQILGFTLANDVSAWDMERENPLYLPQSKTYTACVSLGPWFVTPDEIGDPYQIAVTCRIERNDKTLFDGSTSTARLNRKFETIVEYLRRANPVPAGTVLCTGTGIIVKEDAALAAGDLVIIESPSIGALRNPVVIV
jgi:2-dehydro-3-deoxy-D-arabinonate dehydratase